MSRWSKTQCVKQHRDEFHIHKKTHEEFHGVRGQEKQTREREREAQMRNNLTTTEANRCCIIVLMPHLMKSGARTVKIARRRAAEEDEREREVVFGGNKWELHFVCFFFAIPTIFHRVLLLLTLYIHFLFDDHPALVYMSSILLHIWCGNENEPRNLFVYRKMLIMKYIQPVDCTGWRWGILKVTLNTVERLLAAAKLSLSMSKIITSKNWTLLRQ